MRQKITITIEAPLLAKWVHNAIYEQLESGEDILGFDIEILEENENEELKS